MNIFQDGSIILRHCAVVRMLRIISVVIYLCFYFKLGCHLTTIIYCPDPAQQALMKISQGVMDYSQQYSWRLLSGLCSQIYLENLWRTWRICMDTHFLRGYEGINASLR